MERARQTRLTTAVILTLVFASGLLVGFAADGQLGAEPVPPTDAPVESEASSTAEEDGEPRRGTYLSRMVDPTEEQLVLIDSIVVVHRERTNALDKDTRREYRAAFGEILHETRESIKSVLDADRAAEYQRHLDEYLARREAEREAERESGRDQR